MEQKLLTLLKKKIPEIDFGSSKLLVDDGILDSLSLMTVIELLNKEFGVEIPFEELTGENFNSVAGMVMLVQKLQKSDTLH